MVLPEYCKPLDVFVGQGGAISGAVYVAVMTVIIVLGGILMAARLFKRADWEAYVRTEMWQALISCALIASAVFISGLSCGVASQLAGQAGQDIGHFEVANEYLVRITGIATKSLKDLILKGVTAEYYASYGVQVAQAAWGYSYSPLAGFKGVASSLGLIEGFFPAFVSSLIVQQFGLQFIQATAFTFLLPAGILLRIFSPTRDAGAFLVSTAFGLFIVLPLTYAVYDAAEKVLWADLKNPTGLFSFAKACAPAIASPIPDPNFQLFSTLIFNGMCNSFVELAHVIPQALFLPAMSMVITITFIKALHKEILMKLG